MTTRGRGHVRFSDGSMATFEKRRVFLVESCFNVFGICKDLVMINKLSIKQIFIIGTLISSPLLAQAESIQYTSTAVKDCKLIEANDHGSRMSCPAPRSWKVNLTDNGSATWLTFQNGRTAFDTLEQVINKSILGEFPSVSTGKIEWHRFDKKVTGIIFRMSGQSYEDSASRKSQLFVVAVNHNEFKYCGAVKTNEDARTLLSSDNCRLAQTK